MKKTLRTKHILTATSLTAASFALAPLGRAQSNKDDNQSAEQRAMHQHRSDLAASRAGAVTLVTRDGAQDFKDRTAKKLAGHHVRGSDAKDLGEVKDFLVDPQKGQATYAIVSSGGFAGIGAKHRLVPFESLQPSSSKPDEFSIAIDQAQWDQLPTIDDKEFKNGRFTMTDAQRRQLADFARKPAATTDSSATAATSATTADINAYLVRASDLDGKDLKSGTADLGKIEAIIIETSGTVNALVDPKADLARANTKFLVPVTQLQVAASEHEPVTTMLTRTEFESAKNTSAATTSTTNADEEKQMETTATGATASTNTTAQVDAAQQSTAAAAAAGTIPATTTTTADQALTPTGRTDSSTTASLSGSTSHTSASPSNSATTSDETSKDAVASADKTTAADRTETSDDLKISKTDDQSQAKEMSRANSATGSVALNDSSSTSATSASKSADTTENNSASTSTGAKDAELAQSDSAAKSSTSIASTEQSQDMAAVSGAKKPSSATGETQELSPTGRTEDKDLSVAASDRSETKSPATTTDQVGVDASKSVAASDSTKTSSSVTADKNNTDIGSTDATSTKAAGNIASNEATKAEPTDQQLTPTGKDSSDLVPAGTDAGAATAAQNIRKAFDDDAELGKLQIQVTPEGNNVVLRGSVSDTKQLNAIDKKAREAANGQQIDNQIKVQNDGGK